MFLWQLTTPVSSMVFVEQPGVHPRQGMRRILLAPGLFAGHLFPFLAIGEELARRGHKVFCYAEPEAARFARLAGCVHVPMPAGDARRAFMEVTSTHQLTKVLLRLAERVAPDLLRALHEGRIDAVVTDSTHLGAGLAAERSGIAWATLGTLPVELSRALGAQAAQAKIPTRTLRRRIGLPPTGQTSLAQGISPALYLLSWTPDIRLGRAPRQALHVGPLSWDAPDHAAPEWALKLERRPPPVLFTMSSCPFDFLEDSMRKFFEVSLRVIEQLKVQGIITLSGAKIRPPRRLPPNARVERFVPHSALMPRIRALVTHGGWGVVGRALTHGVPMVIVPFALDQPWNGRYVEREGIGYSLPAEELDVAALSARVQTLVAPKSPERKAAQAIGARVRRMTPARTAAEAVLSL
jgi:UDP:flavonoid glycosyltransferase YjiC (YdhE family)